MRRPLPTPRRYDVPFTYFIDRNALPVEVCAYLRTLFDAGLDWTLHQTFYEAWLAEVTDLIPQTVLGELGHRVAELVRMPLLPDVQVTIQRMEPGQFAGVHTDRPQAGFEAVRLVVQLNDGWAPDHGGVLQVHGVEAGDTVVRDHPPLYGSGFLFPLHADSHHAVTRVVQTRRTVVFNFFHQGNPPRLEAELRDLFAGMHVSKLPDALDPVATRAEASLPEEDTHRAACVAWVLQQWGCPDAVVIAGYEAGLRPLSEDDVGEDRVVLRARWAARMRRVGFDARLWSTLGRLGPTPP